MLELAVGGDLPLEFDQVLGAPVHLAERLETHGAHRDQQDHDGQEGGRSLTWTRQASERPA